jgi:hypothetical protein
MEQEKQAPAIWLAIRPALSGRANGLRPHIRGSVNRLSPAAGAHGFEPLPDNGAVEIRSSGTEMFLIYFPGGRLDLVFAIPARLFSVCSISCLSRCT